jgi:hypothetical protein
MKVRSHTRKVGNKLVAVHSHKRIKPTGSTMTPTKIRKHAR